MCTKVKGCDRPTSQHSIRTGHGAKTVQLPHHFPKSDWEIPSDGIHDEVAIEAAVRGLRKVRLCPTEQRLAARQILAAGGNTETVSQRLCCTAERARAIVHTIGRYHLDDVVIDSI